MIAAAENSWLTQSLLLRAMQGVEIDAASPLQLLERLLWDSLAKLNRDKEERSKQWILCIPLDVDLPAGLTAVKELCLLDLPLVVNQNPSDPTGWKATKAHLRHASDLSPPPISQPCLLVAGSGRDDSEAWSTCVSAVDLLRSICELVVGWQGFYFSSNDVHALRRIPLPATVWRAPADGVWTERVADYAVPVVEKGQRVQLSTAVFKWIDLFQTKFGSEPKSKTSSVHVLLDGLWIYGNVLDHVTAASRFLGFWQVLEAISSDGSGKTDVVVRRTMHILNDARPDIAHAEYFLKAAAEHRNRIAHKGLHFAVDQPTVNCLKWICDTVLVWLATNIDILETVDDLRTFFDRSQLGSEGRARHRRIDDFIDCQLQSETVDRGNSKPSL